MEQAGDEGRSPAIDAVGRVGALEFDYQHRGGRTVLIHSRGSSPWHISPAITLDDSGAVYQPLLNPSGGLVGGDHLSVKVRLGDRAHVLISTPSANRVYRTTGAPSVQSVDLQVGAGALLEWVPELTIPFAGSRFCQTIQVRLAPGGIILLWDAMASGRVARGERWVFDSYRNDIRIACGPTASVVERAHIMKSRPAAPAPLVEPWDYVGSLFLIGDSLVPERMKDLVERFREILDAWPGRVLGGVSEPAAPGLAVKVLARAAPELNSTLDALWTETRSMLWNLPPPLLRRY
jgi:urease accessory protein